jgi:hypothetical protein
MNYNYTGSGFVVIGGCTAINLYVNLTYRFKVGDTCFLRFRAMKGKLEKIVIKEVRVVSNDYTYGAVKFMYIDTFNAIYGEEDLMTEKEAILLAKQYYQYQILLNIDAKTVCTQRPQGKNSFLAPNSVVGGFA